MLSNFSRIPKITASSHQKAAWLYVPGVYFVGYSINIMSLTLSEQIIPNHLLYFSIYVIQCSPSFSVKLLKHIVKWYIVIMVVCNMSWFTQWLRRELRTAGGGQEEASPQEAAFWGTNHSLPFSADATHFSLSPKGRKCGCWRVRITC